MNEQEPALLEDLIGKRYDEALELLDQLELAWSANKWWIVERLMQEAREFVKAEEL